MGRETIKDILGKHGTKHVQLVKRSDGSMYIRSSAPPWTEVEIGNSAYGYDVPRKIARAILELIGDPVPAKGDEPLGDNCHILVEGRPGFWSSGKILGSMSGPYNPTDSVIEASARTGPKGEFHIFRRVATVGPIPQPERKVTRYE